MALAAILSFSLAACGSNSSEEAGDAADEAFAANEAMPSASETAESAGEATPEAEASEGATPTPTPSASASTAAPTPVAAAGPPEAFKQCSICHKTSPGETSIGPTLAGVFGARAGHIAGFKYSPAMADSSLTWNQATLDTYLTDPKALVPGTTMAFGGVKDAAKRADIIAYLKTL
jgi:cytochrome c2